MSWTKLKAIAAVAGALLALGGGIGAASGFLAHSGGRAGEVEPETEAGGPGGRREAQPGRPLPGAGEEVRRRLEGLSGGHAQDHDRGGTHGSFTSSRRRPRITPRRSSPWPRKFPRDPVAVDALLWVAQTGLSAVYSPERPRRPGLRAGAGDPRPGPRRRAPGRRLLPESDLVPGLHQGRLPPGDRRAEPRPGRQGAGDPGPGRIPPISRRPWPRCSSAPTCPSTSTS